MGDVSSGLVRVQPSRLKKLKKIISDCDRQIQQCDYKIMVSRDLLSFCTQSRAQKALASETVKRAKLDSRRKAARLEIKGYGR